MEVKLIWVFEGKKPCVICGGQSHWRPVRLESRLIKVECLACGVYCASYAALSDWSEGRKRRLGCQRLSVRLNRASTSLRSSGGS